MRIRRPAADEYASFYAGYIASVPDNEDLEALLIAQAEETAALLATLPEERALHRYAPDKWSIKEVVGHVADTERVMSYRLLRIARADSAPLAGFDENSWVRAAGFDRRPFGELLADAAAVREASLRLLEGLDEEAVGRTGIANGVHVSARALAWIIAGHERHHARIIRERYLA